MTSVGIIGFGSFGKFLAEKLSPHVRMTVYSHSGKVSEWSAELSDVCAADYVLLAIPLDAYPKTLEEIKSKLRPGTVIVDVCSVKEQPIKPVKQFLPDQPMVATHPLFGPESAAESLSGHTLVLCPDDSDLAALNLIERFADEQGLRVVHMTAAEHDKEMAVVQGLTFFIAHALKDLKLHDQKLSTPSFERLLRLAKLETHHSEELFQTNQAGNVYTAEVRNRFMELCKDLNATIQ